MKETAIKNKVFGIGMNKTGTKTLSVCLKRLGYRNTSYDLDLLKDAKAGHFERIDRVIAEHDSFEDWPWPILFRELYEKYPESRFVLTKRKDSETWFRSLEKQAKMTGPTEFRKLVYGYEMPHENKEEHIRIYNKHNQDVLDFFRNKPGKLLVLCWETGSGWEEICSFLGVPVPNIPFPHANKSARRLTAVFGEDGHSGKEGGCTKGGVRSVSEKIKRVISKIRQVFQ